MRPTRPRARPAPRAAISSPCAAWESVSSSILRKAGRVYQAARAGLNRPEGATLKNVLYLHGFASSPAGRKVAALRERLEPRGLRVLAPDLNIPSFEKLDFKSMAQLAAWEVRRHMPAVVVASSLGALVALAVEKGTLFAPLVLVAPALGFGRRWIEKLPPGDPVTFFHHGSDSDCTIHRRFFEEMAALDFEREPPRVPTVVFMGRRDESVPFEGVRAAWERWEASGKLAAGSRFVEIPDGDHGLVDHVGEIAAEVLALSGR